MMSTDNKQITTNDRLADMVDAVRANAGSTFKLWDKRLDGDTLTRGQIRQWCNAIAAGAYGFIIGGHNNNLTPNECSVLMDKFYERRGGYKLTGDHEKFGFEWLTDYPKRRELCGVTVDMLDTFQGFRFVGTRIDRINDYGPRASILPVYRVLSDAGTVDYAWSPWQQTAYGRRPNNEGPGEL